MKPLLGFLMLLEHDAASTKAVKEKEPHFRVLPEFKDASYARRYEIFCEKAQREGLYDATAFLMSDQRGGLKGEYIEPSDQLTLKTLAAEIYGKAIAYCKQRETATGLRRRAVDANLCSQKPTGSRSPRRPDWTMSWLGRHSPAVRRNDIDVPRQQRLPARMRVVERLCPAARQGRRRSDHQQPYAHSPRLHA